MPRTDAQERDRKRLRRLALLYRNNRAMVKRLTASNAATNTRYGITRKRLRRVLGMAKGWKRHCRWWYNKCKQIQAERDDAKAERDELQQSLTAVTDGWDALTVDYRDSVTALRGRYADIDRLQAERDELQRRLEEAQGVLKRLERSGVSDGADFELGACPECGFETGHAPDCLLDAALAGGEGE